MEPVGSTTCFHLTPGTRLEVFEDGTAILFSPDREETVSLNPTAALLCSYADGRHPLSVVLGEVQELFPDANPALEDFVTCGRDLVERGFLTWATHD